MKKKLLIAVFTTATVLSGCGKEPAAAEPTVSADAVTEAPTPSPTPTPIPLPDNYVQLSDGWTELAAGSENWLSPEWLDGHESILEMDSGVGGIIISSMTSLSPSEVADDIISRYEDAVAANVYATAGDCTVEMAAFGGALGLFSSPKWSDKTTCIFVVGDISSGIGWDLMQKATGNCQQFSVYDYNLSKLLNQRISIDGSIRTMDEGYWSRLVETATENTGWSEADNPDFRTSAQQLYKLVASQSSSVDVISASGKSETVYTNGDGIRVTDVHLPDGFNELEPYRISETKESGVSVSNDMVKLFVEGTVPEKYVTYLDDIIWNEKDLVIWSEEAEAEEASEEVSEEATEGEEIGEGEEPEKAEEPEESEEGSEEESEVPEEKIYLLDYFDAADARAYVFGEVDEPEEGEESKEVEFSGYTLVYYREDGIGCSLYASKHIFENKKRATDFAKQLFQ